MKILGIETSCDETGIAIYDSSIGLLADCLFSQVDTHAEFGGVVPELASRDHIRKLVPLVRKTMLEGGLDFGDLEGIAYTLGPGLAGSLLVGSTFGRSLAYSLGIPSLGVHHMEGHLLAPFLEPKTKIHMPFLGLLVSGGHTLLVYVRGVGNYVILGESLDDAAGEAFDKVAKMLGLGYPGGPAIEKIALLGEPDAYSFPRPMIDRPGLDFSFSGLKTAVRNVIVKEIQTDLRNAAIARAFSEAVIDTLRIKCVRALKQTGLKRLVVAGGVSANQALRTTMIEQCEEIGVDVSFPPLRYATDNGAMIAYAGYQRLKAGERDRENVRIRPRWPLDQLAPLGIS